MKKTAKQSDLLLDNKQIKSLSVSQTDIPAIWQLYWLKKTEYNVNVKLQFKGNSPHNHSFFEIHFLTEGSISYKIGDEIIELRAGEFLVVSPYTKHTVVSGSDVVKKIAIGFDLHIDEQSPLFVKLKQMKSVPYHYGKYNNCIISPLQLILNEMDMKDYNADFLKRSLLNAFMLSLMKELPLGDETNQEPDTEKTEINTGDESVYLAVVKYLELNIDRIVSIEELSNVLTISVSQLKRRLFRYSGISYRTIREKIKIARARELLATNMSMAQISEAIGISNEYNFNRFFKRIEGMTPGKFREILQTNNYK